MKEITVRPIGVVHSPYKERADIPCQGSRSKEVGVVEVFDEYAEGLKDVDGFSHVVLLFHFHKAERVDLIAKPFLDDKPKGIFAIRSPFRPNHIGLTVVKLVKIEGNKLTVANMDCLDGTPLLDIKPYIPEFDDKGEVRIGWLEGKLRRK